ncbi:hypothetical protein HanPI659440_Chr09g0334061 [Helianthus annuus]|nr:hypothetical protein HanPI659440_Chr09g0334061 [Helianthus annuus]
MWHLIGFTNFGANFVYGKRCHPNLVDQRCLTKCFVIIQHDYKFVRRSILQMETCIVSINDKRCHI